MTHCAAPCLLRGAAPPRPARRGVRTSTFASSSISGGAHAAGACVLARPVGRRGGWRPMDRSNRVACNASERALAFPEVVGRR
eukprot:scaffold575_cov313-Prasinococcus_capsulatus_cf.AAC.1